MKRICPHCGKDNHELEFVDDICINCKLNKVKVNLIDRVKITICPKCDRVRISGEWRKKTPKQIRNVVDKKFTKAGFEGKFDVLNSVWNGYWGDVDYNHPVDIIWEKIVCPICEKTTGNYHEAILQLRGDKIKVENYSKKLIRRLLRRTFLPRIESMHGGVDIYIGMKKDVAKVLQNSGLKFIRTEKLVGQKKDGKRLYRSTFLVKFEK